MRKEADDVGPKAELDHWKKRLARFDSLTACLKSQQCRTVVTVLVASKSKVLKVQYVNGSCCYGNFSRLGRNWTYK